MNTRELAQAISEALEDVVRIDTSPKVKKDFASLDCEDDDGNSFIIRVIQTNTSDEDADDEDDSGVIIESVEDVDL